MSDQRVLITGAGGFVGPHLIKELQSQGNCEIFAAVFKSSSDISDLVSSDHLIAGDLSDPAFALKLIQTCQPDVIYHLAALSVVQGSATQAIKIMNANTTLQYNLLEAVRLHSPNARFIAICSANEYGQVKAADLPIKESAPFRPLNPYAVSKITQEMLALQYYLAYGLDIVILRPFNHTGVGQTTDFVIPALAKQFVNLKQGSESVIEVGNLSTTRDFTDVSDMVKAYILASEKCLSGEAYNIGSGHGYTVKEIIDLLQALTGQTVYVKESASRIRQSDVPILIADTTKFTTATGWSPKIKLEDTLTGILNYWRNL